MRHRRSSLEIEAALAEGEALVFKYSPPMVVTQPGHITVSDFSSYEKIEQDMNHTAHALALDKKVYDEKIRKQEEMPARICSAGSFWSVSYRRRSC